MMFEKADEYRHKNNKIRVEAAKPLPVEQWVKVNAKVSEIAKLLKEGSTK